jgi:hypothetical protein
MRFSFSKIQKIWRSAGFRFAESKSSRWWWVSMSGFERLDRLSFPRPRGGAPEGKRNGNYRHGCRTKEMIEVWKLIKSLR